MGQHTRSPCAEHKALKKHTHLQSVHFSTNLKRDNGLCFHFPEHRTPKMHTQWVLLRMSPKRDTHLLCVPRAKYVGGAYTSAIGFFGTNPLAEHLVAAAGLA